MKSRISLFLSCFILLSILKVDTAFGIQIDTTLYKGKNFPEYGYTIYNENTEAADAYFNTGLAYFKNIGDTSSFITCMIGLSDFERRKGHYNNAFDILWDAEQEMGNVNNVEIEMNLQKRLGMLYGIFGKDSVALFHLKKSLSFAKKHPTKELLNPSYFEIAQQYVNMQQYDQALNYLDSCYLSHPGNNRLIYVDAFYGYIFTKKQNFRKSQIYFKDLLDEFEKAEKAFRAKVYAYYAELKLGMNQLDSAIYYYERSLDVIDRLNVHNEIKPQVLEALANLHQKKGNFEKAYFYLNTHKEISNNLFHTQSRQNKELFEIKTKYKEDLSIKEEQIQSQEQLLKLQEKAGFRLKLLLGILFLLMAIGFVTLWQRQRMKHLVKNKKQNDALIEIKNKELTANALQFIEKEHAFEELMEYIKEQAPEKFKAFNYKSKQSNKRIWDDFHLRFTQTNSQFYKQLRKLHPTLTQTDLKHCALVKLNFDSKEMAVILGISLHGVHTARSRIRKKTGLKREDSLSNYLASIN